MNPILSSLLFKPRQVHLLLIVTLKLDCQQTDLYILFIFVRLFVFAIVLPKDNWHTYPAYSYHEQFTLVLEKHSG